MEQFAPHVSIIGSAPCPALFHAAAGGLSLPRISAAVPLCIEDLRRTADKVRIFDNFLAAGIVSPEDIPPDISKPLEAARTTLNAWLHRELGSLRVLGLALVACKERQYHEDADQIVISWYIRHQPILVPVGASLTALDASYAGLGAAIIAAITNATCHRTVDFFMPDDALDYASYYQWQGESDETAYLDTCTDDLEERAEIEESIVKRKDFDDAMPAWAMPRWTHFREAAARTPRRRKPRKVSIDWAAAIAAVADSQRDLVQACQQLSALRFRGDCQIQSDGEFTGWAAVLSWNESPDVVEQMFDDMMNNIFNGGGESYEESGTHRVPVGDVRAMRAWARLMRPRLKAIRLLDDILWHFGARP
jgi:PRTRC genetic system protein F